MLTPAAISPLRACTTRSIPARRAAGPRRPNALTLPTTRRGWCGARLAQSRASSAARAGAKVGEHHAGAREQAVHDTPGGRMAEVERQRVLAPVPRDEVARLAGRQR